LGKAGLVLMAVLASSSAALAAGDPSAGQTVFASHCAVCHSTQAGVNKIAPSLAGIVGSKSGTVAGFDFSPAMKDANITWDDNNAAATDKSKMKQGWPASQARQDRAQGRRLTGVYMEESHVSTGTSRSLSWTPKMRQLAKVEPCP
jgi:mono/diheme cytochrome c family protein